MREKRATIKDVAQMAQVSAATVSIVLNGKGDSVPESTKERVRQVAEQLRYTPDFNARAMVTKKTNTIGVIIPDISNGFFAELVRGIQVELSKYNYDIILCNSEEKKDNDLRYINLLANRNVDGLILTMSAESLTDSAEWEMRRLLQDIDIPYLFLDRYYRGAKPKVVVDNVESSYRIAKYLTSCGHRRIGAITGPLDLNSSYNRLKGLRRALEEVGERLAEDCVYEGKYDYESGRCGAKRLIAQNVTAIFAFSDMQAFGVYNYVRSIGLSIPADISVVGFDDTFYSSLLETPLTTMRQPIKKMSEATCSMILDLINGGKEDAEVKLQAEMVVRASVRDLNGGGTEE